MNDYFDSIHSRKRANTQRLLFLFIYFNFRVGDPASVGACGKDLPVVGPKVIGHTQHMIATSHHALLAQYSYQRSRGRSPSPQFRSLMTWLQLGALALVSLNAAASRDQAAIKEEVTVQVQNAAAATYLTDPGVVQVRLADRRLVLPDCQGPFAVSFPFNDRATAQLDCTTPQWRGFVQIRLNGGISVFRYNTVLNAGDALKRGDVVRSTLPGGISVNSPVLVLEDVLDQTLVVAAQPGEILLESHFTAVTATGTETSKGSAIQGWFATKYIPRGNRLSRDAFSWRVVQGRAPSDLIPADASFPYLEALRDINPGDNLRRSAVKMAPAVRKNEEIKVYLVRGALTVTNVVRISQDATIGESIDVVNIESGRSLRARVTGIGAVELL